MWHFNVPVCSQGNPLILFPENLIVSRGEAVGNIEIRGKQINCFPRDQSSRNSQSIKIGIDLSTNKSMKIGISETKIVIQ